MRNIGMGALALFSATFPLTNARAGYATSVLQYTPGTGGQAGYDQPSAALGEPSRVTPGQFGGPVDPFNSPYLAEQVVSTGAGGSLSVELGDPILNSASNPHGLDFIIYGNAGFIITNGDYSGGGITDGSLYGGNEAVTRVAVSQDGQNFYELSPSLAPVVDGLFPTDGNGDFSVPVNPALAPSAFSGKDTSGIRNLYARSGGGTGFDLDWARDAQGNPVHLDSARFVRVSVLSGHAEIDGFSVVPEPATWALGAAGLFLLAALKPKRVQ